VVHRLLGGCIDVGHGISYSKRTVGHK
jgi:hypothetical protein